MDFLSSYTASIGNENPLYGNIPIKIFLDAIFMLYRGVSPYTMNSHMQKNILGDVQTLTV